MTVESQAANDLGTYSLTLLPIAEPLFGLYSVTLPITLTAQSGVAGIYTDDASASGYTTQSLAEDISTTDAIAQDFILMP